MRVNHKGCYRGNEVGLAGGRSGQAGMQRRWWSQDHHRRLGLRLLRDLALAASVVHVGNVVSVVAAPGWSSFFTAELISGLTTGFVLAVWRFTNERWHARLFALLVIMVGIRWCVSPPNTTAPAPWFCPSRAGPIITGQDHQTGYKNPSFAIQKKRLISSLSGRSYNNRAVH